MSAIGTKRTLHRGWLISAFGGKADNSSPPASAHRVCMCGEGILAERGDLARHLILKTLAFARIEVTRRPLLALL